MAGESSLGDADNMDTPREINIVDFVQCRALELEEMMKAVSEPVVGGSRSVMQLLPRHMRRRAANHDVRRLPLKRRLEAHSSIANGAKLRKRPSRRHRRRPKNLLMEYARRKRRNIWLETHIWHAKRFHMTEIWGYKVPNYPNDRGVRAAYRDATTQCVIMDLSYYCCIEVSGQQQHVVDSLTRITSPEIGPTFGAVCYITGTTQGRTVLYRENSYPLNALGSVTFLWRPLPTASSECDGNQSCRQLWIWTHPACYSDILTELMKVFELTEADSTSVPVSSGCGIHISSEEMDQLGRRKRKKKRKDDSACPKRPKLSKNSLADVAAVTEDTVDSSATSHDTVIAHSEATEQFLEVSDKTKTPSLAKSANITVESRGTGINNSSRIKSVNSVQCGEQHLLSKTKLLQSVYKNSKVRLESLKDELCRFRLIGPKSHHVIVEALRLAEASNVGESDDTKVDQRLSAEAPSRWWDEYIASERGSAESARQASSWKKVAVVQNAAELPQFSVHGLTVRDPRLFLPQRRTSVSCSACGDRVYPVLNSMEALASSSPVWDRAVRDQVLQTKMSTAELNRHRSHCLLPGSVPYLGQQESRIPVLLVQNPGYRSSCFLHFTQQQGGGGAGFDLILPAGWSMAFWIALVYRGAKAVGLREQRSLAFEAGELIFPDCCPDTPSSAEMNSSRAAELRSAYNRRPPAKRCNYDKMGVPTPFHCPWLELVQEWMLSCKDNGDDDLNEQLFYCIRNRKLLRLLNDVCTGMASQSKSCRQNTVQGYASTGVLTELQQSGRAIIKVRVVMLGRGAPSQFALICLPTQKDILDTERKRNHDRDFVEGLVEPIHRKSSHTEATDLKPASVLGSTVRPTIGFVVEGGYSHAVGKGSGVGFVSALGLRRLLRQRPDAVSRTTVLLRCTQSLQYRPALLHIVI